MKPKEILKRSYYALTSVAFFVILLNSWIPSFIGTYHRLFSHLKIGVSGLLLTLVVAVYCWIMSQNNGKSAWKWYAGTIPIVLLILRALCVTLLTALARHNQEYINIYLVDVIFFTTLMLYMAIITFCSKTKYNYNNILPNQTKTDTQIFKWLFIIAQIAVWVCFAMIIFEFLGKFDWWPTLGMISITSSLSRSARSLSLNEQKYYLQY